MPHKWIKTPQKEAGLGPAGGGIPGQNTLPDLPLSPTAINDHTGEAEQPGATCEVIWGCDVNRVNEYLRIGQPRGPWVVGFNDCWTFASEAIHYGKTSVDLYKKKLDSAKRGYQSGIGIPR